MIELLSFFIGIFLVFEVIIWMLITFQIRSSVKKIAQTEAKITDLQRVSQKESTSSKASKSSNSSKKIFKALQKSSPKKISKSGSSSRRKAGLKNDLIQLGVPQVADLSKLEPFPMPKPTFPRIKVDRLKDPEPLIDCADRLAEFIKWYKDNIDQLPVSADVLPGFLAHRMPSHPPEQRHTFEQILKDFANLILPGMTHWQHPRFLAPQMAGPSIPDAMAEMICSQMSSIGFSWDSSPSCNELDVVVTNWAGRSLGIPEAFLFNGNTEFSQGGGTITESIADSHMCVLMSARWTVTNRLMLRDCHIKDASPGYLNDPLTADNFDLHHRYYEKLVVYGSSEAQTSLEKISRLTMLRCRKIQALPKYGYGMSAEQLEEQIQEDIKMQLVPCCVVVTLGIGGLLVDDNLEEIGYVAKKYNCWLHVDASNVAGFWLDPSVRPSAAHLLLADSILAHLRFHSVNVMILWNQNQRDYKMGFYINASYLRGSRQHQFDSRDWTMHLSRRVRSLKMFFVYTMIGGEAMRSHVKKLMILTEKLREQLAKHPNIRLVGQRRNNVFSFQYKEPKMSERDVYKYTQRLGKFINESKRLFLRAIDCAGTTMLMASINYENSTEETINSLARTIYQFVDEFTKKKDDVHLLKYAAEPEKLSSMLSIRKESGNTF